MARNKKKGGRKPPRGGNTGKPGPKPLAGQPANPIAPPPDPKVQEIEATRKEAQQGAGEKERKALTADPLPRGASLESIWEVAREARDLFRAQTAKAREAETGAEELMAQLDKDRARLDDERQGLATEKQALESEREKHVQEVKAAQAHIAEEERGIREKQQASEARGRQLDQEDRRLRTEVTRQAKKEQELQERELNAEAGFAMERQRSLEQLQQVAARLEQRMVEVETRIADEQAAWTDEQVKARADLAEELARRRRTHAEALEQERSAMVEDQERREKEAADEQARAAAEQKEQDDRLAQQARELEQIRTQLDYEKQDLAELRVDLDRRVEQRMAAREEEHQGEMEALRARLEQAQRDRGALDRVVREMERAEKVFGDRSPPEVLEELERLRQDREDLRRKLAERPDADATARLAALEAQQASWEQERFALLRENQEFKTRLARADLAGGDLEILRDQHDADQVRISVLREAVETLKAEFNELTDRAKEQTPFPACTAMDRDDEVQQEPQGLTTVDDLQAFVADLQQRIAVDPKRPDIRLYYSLADLRSFLGGLAMGPLTLLQGISGTGKTSLPVAFARALGTTETMVEVQAGWRDPQDLAGHYNAFERKFYEMEFLKGLYRAQTPRYKDTVQMIVLDEMNLSYPEQYFSDLLSALEQRQDKRRLVLMTHAAPSAPRLLREGRILPIPPNVWFVGTANHDETTREFADKTYDRAHVMEFPDLPETVPVSGFPKKRAPVSYTSLVEAFERARKAHKDEAALVIRYLDEKIRAPLKRDFGIGMASRLRRQLFSYVPVVLAAGGSVSEATDHVMAMRVLRKVKNRHQNQPEHLEALRKTLEDTWGMLGAGYPDRSKKLIQKELRRWKGDERDELDDLEELDG